MLPHNWQEDIVATRSRIESHWSTPNPGAIARFIAEEAGELLAVMNRLANPELLRSTPLEEKDRPQRELGQTLCMVGSLANSLGIHVRPALPGTRREPRSVMIACTWLNYLAADLAHTVTVSQENRENPKLLTITAGHAIDTITGYIIEVGELMGIDPYEALVDWLVAIEAKVETIRRQELEAAI